MTKFVMILMLILHGKLALAIACYECNQFPLESQSPCPGRRTVNYGFQHDACVIYQLSDGKIVFQRGTSSLSVDSPCRKNHSEVAGIIRRSFAGAEGSAMCCMSHGCNDMIPKSLRLDRGAAGGIFMEDAVTTYDAERRRGGPTSSAPLSNPLKQVIRSTGSKIKTLSNLITVVLIFLPTTTGL